MPTESKNVEIDYETAIQKSLVKRLILQEDKDALLNQLMQKYEKEEAKILLDTAIEKYEELRKSDDWSDIEARAFFGTRPMTVTGRIYLLAGLSLIGIGIGSSIWSYFSSISGFYSIYTGAILFGGYLCFRSDKHRI